MRSVLTEHIPRGSRVPGIPSNEGETTRYKKVSFVSCEYRACLPTRCIGYRSSRHESAGAVQWGGAILQITREGHTIYIYGQSNTSLTSAYFLLYRSDDRRRKRAHDRHGYMPWLSRLAGGLVLLHPLPRPDAKSVILARQATVEQTTGRGPDRQAQKKRKRRHRVSA